MSSLGLHQVQEMARARDRCPCGSGGFIDVALLSLLQANTGSHGRFDMAAYYPFFWQRGGGVELAA